MNAYLSPAPSARRSRVWRQTWEAVLFMCSHSRDEGCRAMMPRRPMPKKFLASITRKRQGQTPCSC